MRCARKSPTGYAQISADELARIARDEGLTIVNVHIPFGGDVPDTDLSIPHNRISQERDQLPSKDEPIVLYCRSGSMSTAAARVLVDLGYTRVMELDGGFNAWRASGRKLIR